MARPAARVGISALTLVPTLRVGTHAGTLRVPEHEFGSPNLFYRDAERRKHAFPRGAWERRSWVALALGLSIAAGCAPAPAPKAPPAPAQVTVVHAVRGTAHHAVEQPGEIEAFYQAPLFARVSGYVLKVNKDIGDRVQEGDVLAELSVPELDEDLRQKEAAAAEAEAGAEQARQALAAADAAVASAAALVKEAEAGRKRADANLEHWQGQYKRLQDLFKGQQLNEQQLDEAKYEAKAAEGAKEEVEAKVVASEAARKEAEAKRDKAAADLRAAQAHVQVAQAARRGAAAWADYARIKAPFAGVVTYRGVDPGRLPAVAAGPSGAPLFVVAMTDPVRLFIDVPEADAALVAAGTPAAVRVPALGGQEFAGKAARTAWALDPKTRTLRAEIDLSNADGRLRPGMYCHAVVTASHENVWTLPASAVATQGDKTFAFRVEDGKAVRTPLKTGFRDAKAVEVVQKQSKAPAAGEKEAWEDVTGAEDFIRDGVSALTDGQAVAVDAPK
jgi:HlyD family secretion protein